MNYTELHREFTESHREIKLYLFMNINQITEKIIGCAINVHKELGPGLLESAYEECLMYELKQAGLIAERQVPVPVNFNVVLLKNGIKRYKL
jgi:hypothetical protein